LITKYLGAISCVAQVLRIKPPMCISKQDADFAADILQLAIARFADRIKNKKL
jgi:4-aminobutyrate aminotransferase-like enzyme